MIIILINKKINLNFIIASKKMYPKKFQILMHFNKYSTLDNLYLKYKNNFLNI